jgi:hypothetical protein
MNGMNGGQAGCPNKCWAITHMVSTGREKEVGGQGVRLNPLGVLSHARNPPPSLYV